MMCNLQTLFSDVMLVSLNLSRWDYSCHRNFQGHSFPPSLLSILPFFLSESSCQRFPSTPSAGENERKPTSSLHCHTCPPPQLSLWIQLGSNLVPLVKGWGDGTRHGKNMTYHTGPKTARSSMVQWEVPCAQAKIPGWGMGHDSFS